MKEIKALKSGKWADSDGPHKPAIIIFKGQVYTEKKVPIHMMDHLVGKKFAKFVGEKQASTKDETIQENTGNDDQFNIREVLGEIVESASNKRSAKDALETWAVKNLNGFELDKRPKVEDCIDVLVGVYNEQNGD